MSLARVVRSLVGLLILTAVWNLPRTTLLSSFARQAPATVASQVQATLGKLPLYFIENRGQVDERVVYYAQGKDTALAFTAEGATFVFTQQTSLFSGVKASPSTQERVCHRFYRFYGSFVSRRDWA